MMDEIRVQSVFQGENVPHHTTIDPTLCCAPDEREREIIKNKIEQREHLQKTKLLLIHMICFYYILRLSLFA